MNKKEFADKLRARLSWLPPKEIEDRISFYMEMIDDRMEDGLSEKEAIARLGSFDIIESHAIKNTTFTKIIREKARQKSNRGKYTILLLCLGSPIWLSLAIAAVAVIISLLATLFSLIVSLWAIFVSLAVSAIASVPVAILVAVNANLLSGIGLLGCGLFCAGLSIFLFFGSVAASKGSITLTKKIFISLKKLLCN